MPEPAPRPRRRETRPSRATATDDEPLRPVTIYLPASVIAGLESDARRDGRSGVSAQVRWLLAHGPRR